MTEHSWSPGDPVAVVPRHAFGNPEHPDVRYGTVQSVNGRYVSVAFASGSTHAVDKIRLVLCSGRGFAPLRPDTCVLQSHQETEAR